MPPVEAPGAPVALEHPQAEPLGPFGLGDVEQRRPDPLPGLAGGEEQVVEPLAGQDQVADQASVALGDPARAVALEPPSHPPVGGLAGVDHGRHAPDVGEPAVHVDVRHRVGVLGGRRPEHQVCCRMPGRALRRHPRLLSRGAAGPSTYPSAPVGGEGVDVPAPGPGSRRPGPGKGRRSGTAVPVAGTRLQRTVGVSRHARGPTPRRHHDRHHRSRDPGPSGRC